MVETAIAKRKQGLQSLSPQEVRTLLPVGRATDNEIRVFIRYCQAVSADPWAKEVYLVKYQETAVAAIVLALNWYLKRASHNPAYESYESGVIVKREGEYIDVVGSVVYEGDSLFGGWCKVYKKGVQRPFERRVTMAEYDRHQFGWKTMPATMIEKVAIVQGIRRAFPDEFTGFAEKAELPVVLEGEVEELPSGSSTMPIRRPGYEPWSDAIGVPQEAKIVQEGPQEGQEPPPESGSGFAKATLERAVQEGFSGQTLGDLWNWGLALGYKNKAAMLTALGVKDDALIGDLQEAAKKLAAKAQEK